MKKIHSYLLIILVGFLPLFLKNQGWIFNDVTRTSREDTTPPADTTDQTAWDQQKVDERNAQERAMDQGANPAQTDTTTDTSTNETQEREAGCIAEGYLSCEDKQTTERRTNNADTSTTNRISREDTIPPADTTDQAAWDQQKVDERNAQERAMDQGANPDQTDTSTDTTTSREDTTPPADTTTDTSTDASTNETQEREAGCIAEGYLSCEDKQATEGRTNNTDTSTDTSTDASTNETQAREAGCIAEGYLSCEDKQAAERRTNNADTSTDTTTSREDTTPSSDTSSDNPYAIDPYSVDPYQARGEPTPTTENIAQRKAAQEIQKDLNTSAERRLKETKSNELQILNADNEKTVITRDTKIHVAPTLAEAETKTRDLLRKASDLDNLNNNIIITPFTDSDGDGISDFQERQYGTDPFNPDSDGDGKTDGQEILTLNTDPLKAPEKEENVNQTPSINNLNGKTTGSQPLVIGNATPNENITVTATQDHKNNIKICETKSNEQGIFTCQPSQELASGDYSLYADPKKEIQIKVAAKHEEEKLNIEVKEVPKTLTVLKDTQKLLNVFTKILGEKMSEVYLREPMENLLASQAINKIQKLIGLSAPAPNTNIIITWKSVTTNSTVIADASSGQFEATIPKELIAEKGYHTVLAYIYNTELNTISNMKELSFFIN